MSEDKAAPEALPNELQFYYDVFHGMINCILCGGRVTEAKIARNSQATLDHQSYTFSLTIETTAEIRHRAQAMSEAPNDKRA